MYCGIAANLVRMLREAMPYFWACVIIFGAAYWLYMWQRKTRLERQIQALVQNLEVGRDLIQQQQWSEAVAALDRALALVRHEPTREAELYFYKGFALEQMQQREQAICAYVACRDSKASQREPKYRALATFRQGYLLTQLGRWKEAERNLQESIKEAGQIPLPGLYLNALRILVGVYQATRRYEEAATCAQEALRLAHSLKDEPAEAFVFDLIGDICLARGQTDEALHNYERSLDLFRKLGRTHAELVVKQDISKLYQLIGEWDKAFAWLQACLWEEERAKNLAGQARFCYDIACLYISKGELDKAADLLQRCMILYRQIRDKAGTDQVGRTLMGLSIWIHRQATAGQLTFRDIERGSAKLKKEDKE